jgi:sulfide dehydrogenase [flavocytochrome c] flavoprotein subunit
MTIQINRRKLLKLAAFAPLSLMGLTQINSKTGAKVVIVGGGFGGATCARYLKNIAPELQVTLIEKEEQIVTCPFSNTVISGQNDINYISHSFDGLKKDGITVLRGLVISVEPKTKTIKLHDGSIVQFDRLVL